MIFRVSGFSGGRTSDFLKWYRLEYIFDDPQLVVAESSPIEHLLPAAIDPGFDVSNDAKSIITVQAKRFDAA